MLTFISLISIFCWVMMVFTRSNDWENDYGPDSRQPEQDSVGALGSVFS